MLRRLFDSADREHRIHIIDREFAEVQAVAETSNGVHAASVYDAARSSSSFTRTAYTGESANGWRSPAFLYPQLS
jgi:hypothetical protein